MNASAPASLAESLLRGQHVSAEGYATFLRDYGVSPTTLDTYLSAQARFIRCYPDLRQWFAAPLVERVGRILGKNGPVYTNSCAYDARPYLMFLAFHGVIQFDWPWLMAVPRLRVRDFFAYHRLDQALVQLAQEAVRSSGWLAASSYTIQISRSRRSAMST
jgi:hypothetical protein